MRRQRYQETPAAWAREHGITVGTRLRGDEGSGPETIEVTAIGRDQVLAVRPDRISGTRETSWVFYCRDWEVVS